MRRSRIDDPPPSALVGMTPPPRSGMASSHSLPSINGRPGGPKSMPAATPGRSRAKGERVPLPLEPLSRIAEPAAGQTSDAAGRRRTAAREAAPPPLPDQLPTRSPLLALEMELIQAQSGDEKVAACFNALRGLRNAISRPLQPLLEAVSKEMWLSAVAVGGHAAASEEERLRSLVAQKDAELARVAAELEAAKEEVARLSNENAALLRERQGPVAESPAAAAVKRRSLIQLQVQQMSAPAASSTDGVGSSRDVSPVPGGAPPERDQGVAFARLATQASGRNVFDRVDSFAGNLKSPSLKAHRERVREKSSRSLLQHESLGAPLPEEEPASAEADEDDFEEDEGEDDEFEEDEHEDGGGGAEGGSVS